jgi:methionyl aminopeptidase
MIYYKTLEEIELIRLSADILGRTHGELAKVIKPGVSTKYLDKIAFEFIKDNGAIPSFLNYDGFPATLCISMNHQVVHGIPNDYILQEGDIASVDCGVFYNKFHSDSAYTYPVGTISDNDKKLLSITKESLYLGIKSIIKGSRVGDIAHAIQSHCESNRFSIVRELVGHGVGKNLHEDPQIPNYGKRGSGLKLADGLVIAIEPMVNAGKKNVVKGKDGWTIETSDKKNSAHFEHTVAIINGMPDILTTFKYIEEVLN